MTEYMNQLKSISKNSNFKKSLNKFLLNNSDQSYAVDKIDKIDKNWQRYTILLGNIDHLQENYLFSTFDFLLIFLTMTMFQKIILGFVKDIRLNNNLT